MERAKKPLKLTWKKLGGGAFHCRLDGVSVIIKPGEVFKAYPWEIPAQFQDVVICLDEEALEEIKAKAEEKVTASETLYIVETASAGGWYDVINAETKKVMNETRMRKGPAEELAKELNS